VANCLSQPNGTAEINYGVTGLCHQTANRILHPANLRVDKAQGYNHSFNVYGHYGFPPWNGLASCYSTGGSGATYTDAVDQETVSGRVKSMSKPRPSVGPDNFAATNADDIREQYNPYLSEPLSSEEVGQLLAIMMETRRQQAALAADFKKGRLTSAGFLAASAKLNRWSMAQNHEVLGRERFLAIFGEAGFGEMDLIDREAFFTAHPMLMR
jgi:hypothetical protein